MMAMQRTWKTPIAILVANLTVSILLLLAGCYWFAFRQPHHRGYFGFSLSVLLLSLGVSLFAMLLSSAQNAERKRTTRTT